MNDNIFFIDIYDENANNIPLDNKNKRYKVSMWLNGKNKNEGQGYVQKVFFYQTRPEGPARWER